MNRLLKSYALLMLSLCYFPSQIALSMSHAYVNHTRSSINNYIFVSQSVDGEYGEVVTKAKTSALSNTEEIASFGNRQANWKGVGVKTSVGVEILNFFQLEAGHTFMNMRHSDDGFESLSGSRFHAGGSVVFRSPIINLEGGSGLLIGRNDYQNGYNNTSLMGSGYYHSLGLSRFLYSQVSVFGYARMNKEHLVRTTGSYLVNDLVAETTSMGLGFTLWL